MNFEKAIYGTHLHPEDRLYVLSAFTNRYTRDHVPMWAKVPMNNGKDHPVQFASDHDWLENTRFQVREDGRLDKRVRSCYSNPTWPDNPEQRTVPQSIVIEEE